MKSSQATSPASGSPRTAPVRRTSSACGRSRPAPRWRASARSCGPTWTGSIPTSELTGTQVLPETCSRSVRSHVQATERSPMPLEGKTFDSPDEVREFQANGQVELVNLASGAVGKGTFEPGWRWSNDVKPIAGTDSCQVAHVGYVLSGSMTVRMDDGDEHTYQPGEAFNMPPGHDAWTEGDEPCVLVDFGGLKGYAQSGS